MVYFEIKNAQDASAFLAETNGLHDSSLAFSEDGFVTWCADSSCEPDVLKEATYVIARTMKWRIVLQ